MSITPPRITTSTSDDRALSPSAEVEKVIAAAAEAAAAKEGKQGEAGDRGTQEKQETTTEGEELEEKSEEVENLAEGEEEEPMLMESSTWLVDLSDWLCYRRHRYVPWARCPAVAQPLAFFCAAFVALPRIVWFGM